MEEKKRIRRTKEERAADIDRKMEDLNNALAELADKREDALQAFDEKEQKIRGKIKILQVKKQSILSPAPKKRARRRKKDILAKILKAANKSGLSPEDIAELLGLDAGGDTGGDAEPADGDEA